MMDLRNDDVHSHDIPLSVVISIPPDHLVMDQALAKWRLVPDAPLSKYRLGGQDVAVQCEKFLTLMEGLVEYAQRP
jgi:hypothetical protein